MLKINRLPQYVGEIVDSNIPSTITRDSELTAHTSLTNNPHSVTKAQVGLTNVEDKSAATIIGEIVDSDIPSTIARDSELTAHTSLTNNPHSVTATQLSLENVTNESKAVMFTDPTFTGTISGLVGNGSGLTALNASNISSGTIANARISSGSVTQHSGSITSVGTLTGLGVSGAINFGDRSSNDTLINVESDSGDLTLFRAASFADGVGINIKYIGSGGGDENIFEIATDGGGSFKMDQSGDVGINIAPIDGVGLSTTSAHIVGNVGIGVTPSTAKLHVKNTSSGNVVRQLRLHNDSTTAGTGTGIAFTNSSSETFVGASIDSVRTTSTANGNLVFSTRADATANDDNAVVERMRIDENGNVGIGETAPNVKLLVNAGATNSIAIFQSSDDKAVIQIKDNDTNVHLIAKDNKLALGNSTTDTDKFNVDITNGDVISAGVVNAKGFSLNANTFTVVSTTSTLRSNKWINSDITKHWSYHYHTSNIGSGPRNNIYLRDNPRSYICW